MHNNIINNLLIEIKQIDFTFLYIASREPTIYKPFVAFCNNIF